MSTGDSGELSINIYGSNLANLFPQNGILEWVASTYPNSRLQVIAESIPPGTYIFDFDEFYSTNGREQSLLIYARRKYSEHLYGLRRRKSFTVNEYFSLVIYVQNNDNKTYVVTNARLNYGSIVHPYEPCVFQILTHSFQQHLLGIPVISDGNYIDASGQQFICDLIDFEKGIKIQNIGEVDNNIWNSTPFTGDGHQFKATISGKSNTPILCTNYPYYVAPDTTVGDYITNDASGAQICVRTLEKDFDTIEAFKEYIAETEMRTFYVLAKPIITFLSNEEITAYRNLTTYKGATTILSTPEPVAGIESTYIMDCNKYRDSIEERFASIETKLASITI